MKSGASADKFRHRNKAAQASQSYLDLKHIASAGLDRKKEVYSDKFQPENVAREDF